MDNYSPMRRPRAACVGCEAGDPMSERETVSKCEKVSTATVIGNPTSAPSNPDTLTIIDQLRGIVFQTKHGEPGVSGKRSLTLAVLVGR